VNAGSQPARGTPSEGADFRTTHWSVVLAAGDFSRPEAQAALGELCETYWFPLYAFVRRKGHSPPEAEDLVQEFFARLLEKNYVQQVDPSRGRFRTFLLTALTHFLANEWNRQQTRKRGGGLPVISWDAGTAEERYAREPFHELTPEKLFDRRWALRLLERVHEQLRKEYVAANQKELFDVLEPCLSGDSLPATYVEVGQRLNLSEGAVKVAVHRMRRTYGELVRLEIAHTVARPEEVDEELHHLFEVLRG
jgi:RNA polymerase sigma factor (sigma-70 family)